MPLNGTSWRIRINFSIKTNIMTLSILPIFKGLPSLITAVGGSENSIEKIFKHYVYPTFYFQLQTALPVSQNTWYLCSAGQLFTIVLSTKSEEYCTNHRIVIRILSNLILITSLGLDSLITYCRLWLYATPSFNQIIFGLGSASFMRHSKVTEWPSLISRSVSIISTNVDRTEQKCQYH